ncbi:tryptophan synthase beta subunit-like PLP-dependent enzyme [Paxillus ammoniavirescens]|nr:tryptophan synthase beta subunit-like PLP-dependent enzyme [Paxillus ammoniavirescens]
MEDVPSSSIWIETPLIYSNQISDRLGCSAYLKLENLQPSQSFKYRGISLRLQECKAKYGPTLHVLIASSGNAGLAAAIAARKLGIRCTVYLPVVVSKDTQEMLRNQDANVVLVGQIYSEALKAMHETARGDPNAVVLSSYDDPSLWKGHSSMVTEMKSQLLQKPDAILCSVGGGGLIGGIILGCQTVGWGNGYEDSKACHEVPIVALETHGSNCFYHANSLNTCAFSSRTQSLPVKIAPDAPYTAEMNEEHEVAIPYMHTLTSRATSLGATSPAPAVVRMALNHAGGVKCVCIPDELAMFAAREFGDEHKFLVELACSTTMSAAYNRELFWHILDPTSELSTEEKQKKTVIFVVCGGVKVTFDELMEYSQILDQAAKVEQEWRIVCNGTEFRVPK